MISAILENSIYERGVSTLKTIVLDFEMNLIDSRFKEERKICKNEIIEIGAVMLNDDYVEIDCFKQYVKPFYNEITVHHTGLTGITNEMVAESPYFEEAIYKFLNWIKSHDEGEDVIIYAWSNSDLIQLTREMELKQIAMEPFEGLIHNWRDFQREFCDLLGIEKIISLECALSSIGQKVKGQLHDALWDARNTATIYALSKDPVEFERVMQPILDILKPTDSLSYSLGDLFQKKFRNIVLDN